MLKHLNGYAFEWFVRGILKACGFERVKPDDKIVYKAHCGIMIHGLGQSHNADVLMVPPFQIPFYFPSRILVECKCNDEKVELSIVRSAHGLREDINNFEVVTLDELKKRRDYRRREVALSTDNNYHRFFIKLL